MIYEVNENFYIKEEALQFLLAGIGMRKWYGPYRGKRTEKATIEDAHRILAYLYQENYATWEDGSVQILDPVKTLVKVISGAKNCLSIENLKENLMKLCYLCDDKIAVLEYGKQDKEQIRFSICEEDAFYDFLWKSDIFPEDEIVELYESEMPPLEIEKKKIAILTVIDKQDGRQIKTVSIEQEGIYTFLSEWEELKEKQVLYEKETSRNMIKEMFRMEA